MSFPEASVASFLSRLNSVIPLYLCGQLALLKRVQAMDYDSDYGSVQYFWQPIVLFLA